MDKLIGIFLLVLGEILAINSELFVSVALKNQQKMFPVFLKNGLVITISGFMLITGYFLVYKSTKNIWLASFVSIISIIIAEPFSTYFIFHELPQRGTLIGLILGFLGLLATIFL